MRRGSRGRGGRGPKYKLSAPGCEDQMHFTQAASTTLEPTLLLFPVKSIALPSGAEWEGKDRKGGGAREKAGVGGAAINFATPRFLPRSVAMLQIPTPATPLLPFKWILKLGQNFFPSFSLSH